jgi:glycosyltransferase involved in cell wall biosynthesis
MIEILLATYQGERFLSQQIESILAQSYTEWVLMIHDDGSSDGTIKIARKYAHDYPLKIKFIQDGMVRNSAKENFHHLLTLSTANYVAFCDQDDIWRSDKLNVAYQAIQKLEEQTGTNYPIIFCSDTKIVDDQLRTIANSGWSYSRIGPHIVDTLGTLAVRNYLTGCTMLVNRAAIGVSLPIPREAIMHDWWLGLCVLRSQGSILHSEFPLVMYRQHINNVIGASRFGFENYLRRTKFILSTAKELYSVYVMARCAGAINNPIDFVKHKCIVFLRLIRYHAG